MPESTVSCAVPKFACDVLEAVVGAVFLDNGLDAVRLWDDILRPIFAPLASAMLQQPVAGPTSDSKVPTLDSSAKSTGDSKAMSTSNSKAPMTAPVLVDLRYVCLACLRIAHTHACVVCVNSWVMRLCSIACRSNACVFYVHGICECMRNACMWYLRVHA